MARKIESLTPQQEIELREYFDESMRIGTSCEPADQPRAESAITRMYAVIGKPAPKFIWFDSPATAILGHAVLTKVADKKTISSLRSSLELSLRSSLGSSLRSSLESSLRSSLELSLESSLWSSLRSSLRSSLELSLRSSLELSLRSSLGSSLRSSLGSSLGSVNFRWGQHEQAWVAFYTFCERIGVSYGAEQSKRLSLWRDISASCGWWAPFDGICFCCRRPAEVHINETLVLHNDAGPSMRFLDGWALWSINGVLADEQIVMKPETQKIDQITGEQNEEIKRVRIERFAGREQPPVSGWRKYLHAVNAIRVDERRNEIENTLESLFETPDGEKVLLCHCPSTARMYAMPRPRQITTCAEAQAWGWRGSWLDKARINPKIVGRT